MLSCEYIFYTICVSNTKAKYPRIFPNYELDAAASVGFSFVYFIKDVQTTRFCQNDSQFYI